MSNCGNANSRHWFAYYGRPGTSAPGCQRCDAPNPKYDVDRDPYSVECDKSDDPENRR